MPFSAKRKLWNGGVRSLVYLASGLTVGLLLFLIGYILYRGIP